MMMNRRSGAVSAVSRALPVLIICIVATACSQDKAGVKPAPEPIQSSGYDPGQPGPIRIPDLFSLTQQEAVAKLKHAGLVPVVRTQLEFDFKMTGMHCRVFAQSPFPGKRVAAGTRVVITVYMPVGTCE